MTRTSRWNAIFSTDHKVIGIQYAVTSLCFLLVGFLFMLLMRWQLAYPAQPLPLVGELFGPDRMPDGIMLPEFYNQLAAMHGSIMVFLGIVPLGVGAFGNYLVPLLLGARDMAFPRMNMLSYWTYVLGGVALLAGFAHPGGAASSGWTSYPPLAVIANDGQSFWLAGIFLLGLSSLLASVNMITTVIQLRTPGMGFLKMPFLVWAQTVSAFLLLLAFPPLQSACLLQLMDRLVGTSFFLPSGLVVTGIPVAVSGGGAPVLWQHLFWFLAHPEVYVLILPAMGIVATVIPAGTRKPLYGYRPMVYATVALGIISMLVWAHHMFLTGMGPVMSGFFQATTLIVSIPSVVIVTSLLLSLRGGGFRFSTPMLFALAFLPMFGLGGLTGLPLGMAPTDIHLHDTYYVIGHFHYIVAPGTIFALFAGIYYWYPRVTGRLMNETLGKLHFWTSLLFMNGVFFPMFIQGLAGVSRRLYDGGAQYAHAQDVIHWNLFMSVSAWLLGLAQVPFILNFFWSIRKGRKATPNPWQADTLEWPSPAVSETAAHGAALEAAAGESRVAVAAGARLASARGEGGGGAPGEPSIPRDPSDPARNGGRAMAGALPAPEEGPGFEEIPYRLKRRPDTGVTNGSLGIGLFLASEVMLFGSLAAAYTLLRVNAGVWPSGEILHRGGAVINTILLFAGSVSLILARKALHPRVTSLALAGFLVTSLAFLSIKILDLSTLLSQGILPSVNSFLGLFHLFSGLHGLHVLGGVIYLVWVVLGHAENRSQAAPEGPAAVPDSPLPMRDHIARMGGHTSPKDFLRHRLGLFGAYWVFVDLVWVLILALFYFA